MLLDHGALPVEAVGASASAARRPRISWPVVMAALVLIVGTVVGVRGFGSSSASKSASSATGNVMPISAEIEAKYGIRFTLVAVTAGGGMIEIRYQVLDSDKASAVHSAELAPIIVDSKGTKFADPGMVGHTHVGKAKSPGTTDYILLSNARDGLKSGSMVTIEVGGLELRNVRVD